MRVDIIRSFLLLLLVSQRSTVAQDPQNLERASVSCNAAYSAPCARTNSYYLANLVASSAQQATGEWAQGITDGAANLETGFYPFVFDMDTSICLAHGANPDYVGLTLTEIFEITQIQTANPVALHERFQEGGWVSYLWSDSPVGATERVVNSKLAFVVSNITIPSVSTTSRFYVGVGYENQQLPPDLPCSDQYDSWCAIQKVRSLVGAAQFFLYQATSLAAFEANAHALSFDDDFEIEGGFYPFLYNIRTGRLMAHGRLHNDLGNTLADIFVAKQLGTFAEGQALHEQFSVAVSTKDAEWVQYQWRNSNTEPSYTKIAYLVKIDFEENSFYLGVGFNFALMQDDGSTANEPALLSPDGGCSADYNLPCSFRTAFGLSSHTLSHAISSPLDVTARFDAVSNDLSFQTSDFYVFGYNFNGTCVAHGGNPAFVGMTLEQVFVSVNIPLDASALHSQFKTAAQLGGGWVLYDWLTADNVGFEKISYLFAINLNGQEYYGGIGFNHKQFPAKPNSDLGLDKQGYPIACSSAFDLVCTRVNVQAILGQALADLTLAVSPVGQSNSVMDLDDVLTAISGRSPLYRVNDFFVAVFAVDASLHEECATKDDGSGCCVAHGDSGSDFVGNTWQELLELQEITSIQGADLHRRLEQASSTGGGWIEYPFSQTSGKAQTKRAWVAQFRQDGEILRSFRVSPHESTSDV